MLPSPLHPAIVHFPIVLMFLLPIAAIVAIVAVRRGARPARAGIVPLAVAAVLTLSAWVAQQTGEHDKDRVERAIPEQPLESHEEMAETFVTVSAAVLLFAVGGAVSGKVGRIARPLVVIGSLALIVLGTLTGHSGGQLVYRYDAASALRKVQPPTTTVRAAPGEDP